MSSPCQWLPSKIELDAHGGVWSEYLDEVYRRYMEDLDGKKVVYLGKPVVFRKMPETQGKGFGFWHCISTGQVEESRPPDIERCKRISWIKSVILNAHSPEVESWIEKKHGQIDHLLWVCREYLVILSERGPKKGDPDVYLLKTTYCTLRQHEIDKKIAAMNAGKANAAPKGAAPNTPSTHGG